MNKQQALGSLIFILILFLNLNGIGMDDSQIGLEPGKRLPTFKLPSLNGKEIVLQDFLGKIVIIHLWKCQ
jgi:hypothetical protein